VGKDSKFGKKKGLPGRSLSSDTRRTRGEKKGGTLLKKGEKLKWEKPEGSSFSIFFSDAGGGGGEFER